MFKKHNSCALCRLLTVINCDLFPDTIAFCNCRDGIRLLTAKEKTTRLSGLSFWMQQQPIFPDRRQSSIFGASELNFCVRYENRWALTANVTAMVYIGFLRVYRFLVYSYCTLFFICRQIFYTVDSQLHRFFLVF